MAAPYRITESGQTLAPINGLNNWRTFTPQEARGIIWLFEEPNPQATYVVSCDPVQGITDWDRTIPRDDRTDNAAVEVFRIGKREEKFIDDEGKEKIRVIPTDYQVAEWAAPVDYEGTAAVINALGRLYRGMGRMGVAHTIIEVYPGPGWMVEKTLISKYGYLNFYQRKYIDTLLPQSSNGIGWQATRQSVRDLWIHGTRLITNRTAVIRSPWLHSELKTTDPIKFMSYASEAASGFTDDRLRAFMLSLWAAHDFSSQIKVETVTTIERNKRAVNWQASDMSNDSLKDEWERRFREIGNL